MKKGAFIMYLGFGLGIFSYSVDKISSVRNLFMEIIKDSSELNKLVFMFYGLSIIIFLLGLMMLLHFARIKKYPFSKLNKYVSGRDNYEDERSFNMIFQALGILIIIADIVYFSIYLSPYKNFSLYIFFGIILLGIFLIFFPYVDRDKK